MSALNNEFYIFLLKKSIIKHDIFILTNENKDFKNEY